MTERSQNCDLDGDDNLYGLGIRLGQYCLIYAMIIAVTFRPSKRYVVKSLTIFIIAIHVSLIWKVTTHSSADEVYSIDVFISLMFAALQAIVVLPYLLIFLIWRGVSFILSLLFISTLILNAAFGVWYWFEGIDNLAKGPCRIYSTEWFKKVPLDSRIENVNKGFHVFYLVLMAIILLVGLYITLVLFMQSVPKEMMDEFIRSKSEPEVDAVISKLPLCPWIGLLASSAGMMVAVALYILNIELIIRSNNMQKVGTLKGTGQIIPFIIGLTALLEVLFWTVHAMFVTAELRLVRSRTSASSGPSAPTAPAAAPGVNTGNRHNRPIRLRGWPLSSLSCARSPVSA